MNKVLICGEEGELTELPVQLRSLGFQPTATTCSQTASIACKDQQDFDAIFAHFGEFEHGAALADVSQYRVGLAFPQEIQEVVSAIGSQIDDCLLLPVAVQELRLLFARQASNRSPVQHASQSHPKIVGIDGGLSKAWRIVEKVARHDTNILITGESGTGKELFAEAIHSKSGLPGPFVAINCAAIPIGLMESQLFGHTKGAFTDAHSDKEGVFAKAHGGTLFLDEVGDFPLEMQAKLLRALQTGEIQPVGAEQTQQVKVRLVSATSRDLESMVGTGEFRDDLYYRLATIPIVLPPLRERRADVAQLIDLALARYSEKHEVVRVLGDEARGHLTSANWPGNVRQLHNAIERLVVLAEQEEITAQLVRDEIDLVGTNPPELVIEPRLKDLCLKEAQRLVEAQLISEALRDSQGKRAECAKRLCISPRTLSYKLKEHNLQGKEIFNG